MRVLRPTFTLLIAASFAVVAIAQTEAGSTPPANLEALRTLRQDLVSAAGSMRPCLPIYEGHCGGSKNAVHEAEVIIRAAIAAATPAPAKSAVKEVVPTAKVQTKTNVEKKASATVVPAKPAVKEATPPAATKPKEYTAEMIATSQSSLQKGFDAIQQALKDFKAASPSVPEAKVAKLQQLLETAASEATKALAIHAAKP